MAASGERTAGGVGVMRALEQHARQPLFDDPLAEPMLSGWAAVMVRSRALRWAFLRLLDRAGPGFYGAVVCRTRVIDDACRAALADGLRQIVIIGAGMDTRPYRMPEMAGARVWELDLPGTQRAKKAALARVLTATPDHVSFAPLDLTTEAVGEALARAGADLAAPTLVLCEAVLMYLPETSMQNLFWYDGRLPPESQLILTYLDQKAHDDPGFAGWRRRLAWRTASTPAEMARWLSERGLRVSADVGAAEHQELLLRPSGRILPVFSGERVVVAGR